MIYGISFFVGILNGLFASGAGQILVVYLIFFKKMETHTSRALSVAILSVASIFAIFGYGSVVHYDMTKMIVMGGIALVMGVIGAKVMKKIPSPILNLISGILLVGLTVFRFFSKG